MITKPASQYRNMLLFKKEVQFKIHELQASRAVVEVPDVVVISDKEPIVIELGTNLCVNLWVKFCKKSHELSLTFEKWVEHQNGLVIGWLLTSR